MSAPLRPSPRARIVLGALALVLVLVVGGSLGARETRAPGPLTIEPASRAEARAAHADGDDPLEVPDLPEVPTLPPGATLSRDHGATATAEEAAADIGAEMRLLTDARRSLRGGEPAVALSLLDQHRERFAAGALAEEREAYAIVALRALGHTEDAERRLVDFHANHPGSTLLEHVLAE